MDLLLWRSIDRSTYRPVDLLIDRSIDLHVYRSIHRSMYLVVCLSTYLSTCLSTYLFTYLFGKHISRGPERWRCSSKWTLVWVEQWTRHGSASVATCLSLKPSSFGGRLRCHFTYLQICAARFRAHRCFGGRRRDCCLRCARCFDRLAGGKGLKLLGRPWGMYLIQCGLGGFLV